MKTLLFMLTLLLVAASTTFAQNSAQKTDQSNSAEQTVLKLTEEWLAADGGNDRATLERIIADDFIGTGPRGTTKTKREVIPLEGTRGGGLSITGQDMKARVFADTVIVTGRGVPKTPTERGEMRFTVVFVKRAERWQMVAGHLSVVPQQE
jgi:ketosteroid isomerase-like protein